MKVVQVLLMLFIGWPVSVVSYVIHAAVSGWETGAFMYDEHESEMLEWCVPTKEKPTNGS